MAEAAPGAAAGQRGEAAEVEAAQVRELVQRLRSLVEGARAMPMSSSAVVNRAELLELVDRLETSLEGALAGQDKVVLARDEVVAQGRDESQRLVDEAKHERERLVGDSEVFRVAKVEADKERAQARREADELRRETDEYVDTRLATFEVALTKTLEAVARGRARLDGRSHFAALGEAAGGQEPAGDADGTTPHELRPAPREEGA